MSLRSSLTRGDTRSWGGGGGVVVIVAFDVIVVTFVAVGVVINRSMPC